MTAGNGTDDKKPLTGGLTMLEVKPTLTGGLTGVEVATGCLSDWTTVEWRGVKPVNNGFVVPAPLAPGSSPVFVISDSCSKKLTNSSENDWRTKEKIRKNR